MFASGNGVEVQWSNILPQVALAWQAYLQCCEHGEDCRDAPPSVDLCNKLREKVCRLACLFCGGIAAELLLFVLISGRASLWWRVLELGDTNSRQCYLYYYWLFSDRAPLLFKLFGKPGLLQ